jgi:hypothetical protein
VVSCLHETTDTRYAQLLMTLRLVPMFCASCEAPWRRRLDPALQSTQYQTGWPHQGSVSLCSARNRIVPDFLLTFQAATFSSRYS